MLIQKKYLDNEAQKTRIRHLSANLPAELRKESKRLLYFYVISHECVTFASHKEEA